MDTSGSGAAAVKVRRWKNRVCTEPPVGYFTVRQFAEKSGVSLNTVYTYLDNGHLPCVKRGKHSYIANTLRLRKLDEPREVNGRKFNYRVSMV